MQKIDICTKDDTLAQTAHPGFLNENRSNLAKHPDPQVG